MKIDIIPQAFQTSMSVLLLAQSIHVRSFHPPISSPATGNKIKGVRALSFKFIERLIDRIPTPRNQHTKPLYT